MPNNRKVHLFIPCFVDQIYPQTGLATVKLLRMAGCNIIYPKEQTCCGQPAFNSGYRETATNLAERFIKIFNDAEYIVSPSASCVSMIKNHYAELDLRPLVRHEYDNIKHRIFELSEFLVDELKCTDFNATFPHRVAYHTSCHGYRELGIYDQPVELLRKVKGIDLVEPDDRKQCCGFGGTFSVKFPELSTTIGEDKVEAIQQTGADVVTSTDDSCLMHLQGLFSRNKIPIQTLHYARIIAGGEALI